jgi:hypothetical protein
MYPEIRLIGRVEKVEDGHPNPYERTLSLRVPFRNGSHGAFRVRVPSGEEHAFSAGDEVFVSGELDELGAIHPHRFGAIRKLAPMPVQPKPAPGRDDAQKPGRDVEQTPSEPPAMVAKPDLAQPLQPNPPSTARPAPSQAPRPASVFSKGGGLFGNMRSAPRPSPSPSPAFAAPSGRKPSNPTTSPVAAVPKSFAGVRQRTAQPDAQPTAPSSTRPSPDRPNGHAWDVNGTPRRGLPTKPQSDLAEYLQDEIPW